MNQYEEYNTTVTLDEVIANVEKLGFQKLYERNGRIAFFRIGSDNKPGAFLYSEKKILKVFTTNSVLDSDKSGYNPFQLYKEANNFKIDLDAIRKLESDGKVKPSTYLPSTREICSNESIDGEKPSKYNKLISNLSKNYSFRKNIIKNELEYKKRDSELFERLDEYQFNAILDHLRKLKLDCTSNKLREILDSPFSPKYDPFRDYFENLPVYDLQVDSIRSLFNIICLHPEKKDDYDKILDCFKKWLRGFVACAYDNNPNHTFLILQGTQGCGKTTFLTKLCPTPLKPYLFVGQILDNKDTKQQLGSSFICIDDELESLHRASMGFLKSIISSGSMQIRLPYGRIPEVLPRRASFCGSVNTDSFLSDETGNRRFFVIKIEYVSLEALLLLDIDPVWAQAFYEYKNGEAFFFNQSDNVFVNNSNHENVKSSYIDEYILEFFDTANSKEGAEGCLFWNASKIGHYIQDCLNQKSKGNDFIVNDKSYLGIGKSLRKYEIFSRVKRVNGKNSRGYWVKPLKDFQYLECPAENGATL
jgi:hypothetical protein